MEHPGHPRNVVGKGAQALWLYWVKDGVLEMDRKAVPRNPKKAKFWGRSRHK